MNTPNRENLAPGVISREGFLGPDDRSVRQIVAEDMATLDRLGLTVVQVADGLDRVLKIAMNSCGSTVRVGELQVVFRESMGRLPCPWGGCGAFIKGQAEVTDRTGQTLYFTPLSVHLIREHRFFQGRGTRYRLEPEEIASVLGLI